MSIPPQPDAQVVWPVGRGSDKLVEVDGLLSRNSRNSVWTGRLREARIGDPGDLQDGPPPGGGGGAGGGGAGGGEAGARVVVKRFSSGSRCRTEMRALERMRDSSMSPRLYCGLAGGFGRALEDSEIRWIDGQDPGSEAAGGRRAFHATLPHPQSLILEHVRASGRVPDEYLGEGLPDDRWLLEELGDAFRAVAELHDEAMVIHADVKPDNFLREVATRQIKLIDFDFAVPIPDPTTVVDGSDRVAGGTPLYMPPEAFMHNQLSVASDAWALGVMLYSAAHRRRVLHPFQYYCADLPTKDRWTFVEQFLSRDYSPVVWANPDAPMANDLVARLLSRLPEHRLSVSEAVSRHPFFAGEGPSRLSAGLNAPGRA